MIARTQATGTMLQVHVEAGGIPGNKNGKSVMNGDTSEAIDGKDSLDSDEIETITGAAVCVGARDNDDAG